MEEELESLLESMKNHYAKGGTPLKTFKLNVKRLNTIAESFGATFKADPDNLTPEAMKEIQTDSYGNAVRDDDDDDSWN